MSWEWALEPIAAAVLASLRVGAMLAAAPLFHNLALPPRIVATLGLGVGWALAPELPGGSAWQAWSGLEWGLHLLAEGTIGAAIGFGARVLFAGFEVFGEFVSIEGGLGAAQTLDPSTGASSVVVAQTFNMFGLLVFMLIDGHHELIRAVGLSFQALPLGGGLPDPEGLASIGLLLGDALEVAIRLSGPVAISIFVQNVAIGVMARAMPQLNLMTVQLPAHVGMLLLILGLGAEDVLHAMKDALEVWNGHVLAGLLGAG